jgi:hypothetical protein
MLIHSIHVGHETESGEMYTHGRNWIHSLSDMHARACSTELGMNDTCYKKQPGSAFCENTSESTAWHTWFFMPNLILWMMAYVDLSI